MPEKVCEGCGGQGEIIKEGPLKGSPQGLDYCAVCSCDLCDACMKKGCCGNTPALSDNDES